MKIIEDLSRVPANVTVFRVLFADGNREGSIDFNLFEKVCESRNGIKNVAILFQGTDVIGVLKKTHRIASTGKSVLDLINLLEQISLSNREKGFIIVSDIEHKNEIISSKYALNCKEIKNKLYQCESPVKHKPMYITFLGEKYCIEEELLKCSNIDLPDNINSCRDIKRFIKNKRIDRNNLIENAVKNRCFKQLFDLIEEIENSY